MRFLGILLLLLLSLAACTPAPADVPDDPPAAPVRVEATKWEPFQPTLALLGVVQPSGFAEVAIPVAGRLDYPGRFGSGLVTGAEVREGEVLARISSHDSTADLAEARLRVELTSSELARHQRAFDSGVEAAAVLDSYKAESELARSRLKAAQDRAGSLSLRSPVSGRLIVDLRIPPDSEVAPGIILAAATSTSRRSSARRPSLIDELDFLRAESGASSARSRGAPTPTCSAWSSASSAPRCSRSAATIALGDQTTLEALVRFTDEELKHQELFRRIERDGRRRHARGLPLPAAPNDVAAFVLGKSTWAVLALTCHIELFTQAHYRASIAPTRSLVRLCARTSSCSTGRRSRSTRSSTSSSGGARTRSWRPTPSATPRSTT